MDIATLAPFLAGPGAATIVLLFVCVAMYRLSVSHLIPLAAGALERHLTQVDAIAERLDASQMLHTAEHARILSLTESVLVEIRHVKRT
jgi:hypothetical protein